MKLMCVFLLFAIFQVNAEGYSQTVDLKVTSASLKEVITEIQKQTKYNFMVSSEILKSAKPITLNLKKENISKALDKALEGQNLYYLIQGKTVVVKANKSNTSLDVVQLFTISGTILDQRGSPLRGVSVVQKNTNKTTVSDEKGKFSLAVDNGNSVIVFSFLGFQKEEVSVSGRKTINIILKDQINQLDETVVIGYGTQTKKDLTGSVGTVKVEELTLAPTINFMDAMAGRVAGVQIKTGDGQPGELPNVIIRGPGSLTQDPSPLYVIDGFPLEDFHSSSINNDDIESISVLKDASATAIYGARAANGVIVIETKKGKAGKTVVTVNTNTGFQQIRKTVDVMDAYEFVKYQDELRPEVAKFRYFQNGKTLDSYKGAPAADWQDKVFREGFFNSLNIAARGGDVKTQFALSGSLNTQDGIVINTGTERKQARLALNHSLSSKIKFGVTTNFSNTKNYGVQTALPTTDFPSSPSNYLFYSAWGYRPVSGRDDLDLTLDDVDDVSNPDDPNTRRVNPVALAKNSYQHATINANSINAHLTYTFNRSLFFKTTVNTAKTTRLYENFYNSKTPRGLPIPQNNRGVQADLTNMETDVWSNENTLNYNKLFIKKHKVDALVGFSSQKTKSNLYGILVQDIPNEELGMSGIEEGTEYDSKSARSDFTMASFFGRLNYSYLSKYYFTATFRADGTSKFAPQNRWAYFPSAAVSWNIKEESFLKNVSFISNSKLRASVGLTGNNRVSEFGYLPSYSLPMYAAYSFGNGIPSKGIVPNELGNDGLKWEKSEQIDLGYDLGLFNNKIELTVDLYKKTTRDLILRADLPLILGYQSVYQNIGELENKGLEISLTTANYKVGDFSWNSNFNISFNRNKILALARNQERMTNNILFNANYNEHLFISKIGEPAGQFFGYEWLGNYQYADFDEVATDQYVLKAGVPYYGNDKSFIKPGDIKYADLNGDGYVNDMDRTVIGNPQPKHIGGFTNNFTYKNFDLSVFLQWVYGNKIYNANRLVLEGNGLGVTDLNQYATYVDRWTPENQNNKLFRTWGQGPMGFHSTRVVEDGSFLRLKTVSLGYRFLPKVINKLYLADLRLFVSGQNLLTWTNYSGFDPEVAVRNTVLTSGLDYSAYPQAKTFVFGINAKF